MVAGNAQITSYFHKVSKDKKEAPPARNTSKKRKQADKTTASSSSKPARTPIHRSSSDLTDYEEPSKPPPAKRPRYSAGEPSASAQNQADVTPMKQTKKSARHGQQQLPSPPLTGQPATRKQLTRLRNHSPSAAESSTHHRLTATMPTPQSLARVKSTKIIDLTISSSSHLKAEMPPPPLFKRPKTPERSIKAFETKDTDFSVLDEDDAIIPSSQVTEWLEHSPTRSPSLHDRREVVPSSQSYEMFLLGNSPQLSHRNLPSAPNSPRKPEFVQSSQMDEIISSPSRLHRTPSPMRSPEAARLSQVTGSSPRTPHRLAKHQEESQWAGYPETGASPTPKSPVYSQETTSSPSRTQLKLYTQGYDADESQYLSSPGGLTQTPVKPSRIRQTIESPNRMSPSPSNDRWTPGFSSISQSADQEPMDMDDDDTDSLPDAVKEFRDMFTGDGSYPESFPQSLRY